MKWKIERYNTYKNCIEIITFKCSCGNEELERPEKMKNLTHLEGNYNCTKCKKKIKLLQ